MQRANALDKTIAEIYRYTGWQEKRVAEWKPGELILVKKGA